MPPTRNSTSEEGEARVESKGDSARDRDLGEDGTSSCCAGVAGPGDADAPASCAAPGAVAGAVTVGDGAEAAEQEGINAMSQS